MKKSIIASMSSNHCIGKENQMLWIIPEDQKRFVELTRNDCILMGRKTYESISDKITNKKCIVLSRNENLILKDGFLRASSLEQAFELAESNGEKEIFIIGGGELFDQTINIADSIYLTRLIDRFDGDTFFPAIEFGDFNFRDNEIQRTIYNNFIGEKKHSNEYMIMDRIKSISKKQ